MKVCVIPVLSALCIGTSSATGGPTCADGAGACGQTDAPISGSLEVGPEISDSVYSYGVPWVTPEAEVAGGGTEGRTGSGGIGARGPLGGDEGGQFSPGLIGLRHLGDDAGRDADGRLRR
ncbi:MAG: hypothetical protein GYB53_12580 [Rhodobacteraceae bacterium]|nr:hypothetical protein [Paracoccaceae bacterium]MBR9822896.1 hypothetical protein [Paracoccaceae bacterium]